MIVRPSDVALLLSLIDIATKATAAIKAIRTDSPEVYAAVGKHHADALAGLEAAAGDRVQHPTGD